MNRADWAVAAVLFLLAVSMLATPAGGVGVDGRWVLAALLIAVLARPVLTPKEAA